MDGRGTGSCVELFSVPSGFLVSPSVKLLVGGRGGFGKGGIRVLIPDLVVMARVSALGSRVLLLSIAERIWEIKSLRAEETDIRENDEKSSKNGQNRARNGKA
ncbi:hypothetical protein Tco_1023326 [Tanacetum coccineum]